MKNMKIRKKIRDNEGIDWICELELHSGSRLSISLHSSTNRFRFPLSVGEVDINEKGKTAEIFYFKTKDDDIPGFQLSRIGLGFQIYCILEDYLKSIGIKSIFGEISHKDDKDKEASSFWEHRKYTLVPVENDVSIKYKMHKELE